MNQVCSLHAAEKSVLYIVQAMAANVHLPKRAWRANSTPHFECAMSFAIKSESARERMLKAEEALRHYLEGSVFDLEMERQLFAAASAAREDFIDQLASLFPEGGVTTHEP